MRRLLYGPFDILTKPNSMWTLLRCFLLLCVYDGDIGSIFIFLFFSQLFLSPLVFFSISMFSSCLWAFVDSARSCVICHQLGREGGRVFRPWTFFVVVQKWSSRDSNPFFFPLRSLSSAGFILYHPKLHIRERERWDCCVFHIVYIISFGPEIPLMTHPWLFQQSRKGSDHLFFSFPRLPPKKTRNDVKEIRRHL
jgi:hypothetical protein